MSDATDVKKKPEAAEDKTNNAKIEAYLQGPRKKRKNYVIFALGDKFDRDLAGTIENFVKKEYSTLALSHPKNPEELSRQFGRNISLLIINDEFTDKPGVMKLVRMLKERRQSEAIPVLFLTRDAEDLVNRYHDELLIFNEADEYILYPTTPKQQIFARIKLGIDNQNRRRSRRYSVNIPASIFHLDKNSFIDGRIIDLSMHGAVLSADKEVIFRPGDQMKLSIPVSDFIRYSFGDFIKISAKVRRVFIAGSKVAVSFEHVTDEQSHLIGQVLMSIVSRQFNRQTSRLKAQYAANSSEKRR